MLTLINKRQIYYVILNVTLNLTYKHCIKNKEICEICILKFQFNNVQAKNVLLSKSLHVNFDGLPFVKIRNPQMHDKNFLPINFSLSSAFHLR